MIKSWVFELLNRNWSFVFFLSVNTSMEMDAEGMAKMFASLKVKYFRRIASTVYVAWSHRSMTDAGIQLRTYGGCIAVARSVPLVHYKRFSNAAWCLGSRRFGSLWERDTQRGVIICRRNLHQILIRDPKLSKESFILLVEFEVFIIIQGRNVPY